MLGLIKGGLGALTGFAGSLLGSKGEEGRLKSAFKSGAQGAMTGPIGAGLVEGIKIEKNLTKV